MGSIQVCDIQRFSCDRLLGEHKRECFDRIQEVKESHDLFWQQRREAHSRRQQEFENKKDDFESRVRTNLDKNKQRLRSAADALARQRARAEDLREKIAETNSEKWEGIWGGWLEETEGKIDDIESSIEQIQEWIEEDESRLSGLRE